MSQADLAGKVKVDPTAITRLEGGSRGLRLNEAAAIARALASTVPDMIHRGRHKSDLEALQGALEDLTYVKSEADADLRFARKALKAAAAGEPIPDAPVLAITWDGVARGLRLLKNTAALRASQQ